MDYVYTVWAKTICNFAESTVVYVKHTLPYYPILRLNRYRDVLSSQTELNHLSYTQWSRISLFWRQIDVQARFKLSFDGRHRGGGGTLRPRKLDKLFTKVMIPLEGLARKIDTENLKI